MITGSDLWGHIQIMVLRKQFIYEGNKEVLSEKLNSMQVDSFSIEWLGESEFKFVSKWSFGTFMSIGRPLTEGIVGYATLKESEDSKTEVLLSTKPQWDLILFTIIMGLILTLAYFKTDNMSPWIFLIVPLVHFWFWFVYRLQEGILFSRLETFIQY